jgi:hypothetical protein
MGPRRSTLHDRQARGHGLLRPAAARSHTARARTRRPARAARHAPAGAPAVERWPAAARDPQARMGPGEPQSAKQAGRGETYSLGLWRWLTPPAAGRWS